MKKKESKTKEVETTPATFETIKTKAEMKSFLTVIRDRLVAQSSPPVVAMVAMNHAMSTEGINDLLDKESKEILQEIWVQLSQAGLQLRKPPLLFGDSDTQVR